MTGIPGLSLVDLSTAAWLVPLPVVLPLVGAGLAVVAGRRGRRQRIVTVTTLILTLAVAVGLVVATAGSSPPLVVAAGGWVPPQGVVLVVDKLAALMVAVAATVTLGVALFAIGEGKFIDDASTQESPLPIFHPALLILMAGVDTTFISGDLFHMYVGFEMLLVASFVLLTFGGTEDRVRAGVNYVFVSLLSSLLFLLALAMIYAACGTVIIAQLTERLQTMPAGTRLTLHVLLILGFAVKAAVFPMSGWLPDSYPTAPAPVTAVFAGLLTKVGVYAIIRTETLLFPGGSLSTILLWAALLTMLVGILGCLAQDDIKRLLSFTLVSHIGYMIFGITVGGTAGLSSAIFYVVHHIIVQTALFLVVGLIEHHSGSTSMAGLGGLLRSAPVVALLFFVPAMNLGGIPPLSGFLGKVGLIQAGVDRGDPLAYLLVAGSLLTSLLTLYAVSRVWARVFWRDPEPVALAPSQGHGRPGDAPTTVPATGGGATSTAVGVTEAPRTAQPVPRSLLVPTVFLVTVSTGLTLLAGPLYHYTDRAASDLLTRTPYVSSVFPGGVP